MPAAALNQIDLALHTPTDSISANNALRGTAATRFYVAGLPERVIAEIMGWEEEHVARIVRRYVGRAAATKAVIRLLNERRT